MLILESLAVRVWDWVKDALGSAPHATEPTSAFFLMRVPEHDEALVKVRSCRLLLYIYHGSLLGSAMRRASPMPFPK